jgi:O-antigen ligase
LSYRANPDEQFARRLIAFAQIAAALALFIAPFRATAGFRAGLLVLAALAIVAARWRTGTSAGLTLPAPLLVSAATLWMLCVGAFSISGPDPRESLSSWRGDVLTPMLTCWVFYQLTSSVREIQRFVVVLFAGLFILATMVAVDPFVPINPQHEPMYGTVGLASTWFITLAPLLLVTWQAGKRGNGVWYGVTALATVALIVGAWFTGNRMIWVCYGAMLAIAVMFALLRLEASRARRRMLLAAIVALTVLAAGFYGASVTRADVSMANGEAAVDFMRNDNRSRIWNEAVAMIRERPLAGHGYALPQVADAFAARFTEPWFRTYIRQAHNILLNYALQMGIFAAAVLAALFLALWWTFVQIWRRARTRPDAEIGGIGQLAGVCGLALVTGVFLRNMVDDFFMRHTMLLFAAMVGMFLGLGLRLARKD